MASLKEKVENHPAVFFLAALVVGFASGIGAYQAVLKMSGQETIAVAEHQSLKNKLDSLEKEKTSLSNEVSMLKTKQQEQRWLRVKKIKGSASLK